MSQYSLISALLCLTAAVASIVSCVALIMTWSNLYNADAILSGDVTTDVSGLVGPAFTYVKVGTVSAAVAVLSLVLLAWRTAAQRRA